MSSIVDAAKAAAADQASTLVAKGKSEFISTFSNFMDPVDISRVGELFDRCVKAKVMQFTSSSPELAQEWVEIYEAYMTSLETIGDKYIIVGKAKAGVFVRTMAHQVISGFFAVAGAVLQAGLGIALPGLGSLVGAGLNAGIQHAVTYFLEG